uniref:Dynein light chain n=1 Tax=Salix viminalis TaxID=40686 RepID=A0A6N2LGX0_SALVM
MAHHTNHRRILASSLDLDSPIDHHLSSTSMDPTLKNKRHPKPTNPDPTVPSSKLFYMSKSNLNLRTTQNPTKHPPSPPPNCIDIRLQAKAMTLSADFDACRFSIIRPKHQQPKKKVSGPKVVGKLESKTATAKEDESSKVKKLSSKDQQQQESRMKVEESAGVNEKKSKEVKDHHDLLEWNDMDKRMSSVSLKGRRRSFCGSQVELTDFLASNGAKIVSVDMPPFMQIHAIRCARNAYDSLEKFTSRTLASTLKKEFDQIYGPAWHCLWGTSFGSFVTHSVGGFLYFSMDQKLYVLLFKTTVQRAE